MRNDKMMCASVLHVKRHQAKKVHRHKSAGGNDVIMGLNQFSKPG